MRSHGLDDGSRSGGRWSGGGHGFNLEQPGIFVDAGDDDGQRGVVVTEDLMPDASVGLPVPPVGQVDSDLDEVALCHASLGEDIQDIAPGEATLGIEVVGHDTIGSLGNLAADEQHPAGVDDQGPLCVGAGLRAEAGELHAADDRNRDGQRSSQLAVWWHAEDGHVSAFVIALTIGVLALAGLTLDGGLALAAKVRANGQAESAARAGAQAIDLAAFRSGGSLRLMPEQATADAQAYLTAQRATGTVSVSGDTVLVTVTGAQQTQLLGLIGITRLTVHGEGSAQPHHGGITAEP